MEDRTYLFIGMAYLMPQFRLKQVASLREKKQIESAGTGKMEYPDYRETALKAV